jgi:hypothetical protein
MDSPMTTQPDAESLAIISLGAGVQSTTMYRMAALGHLTPKPSLAIFADTQCEPSWVYENLAQLKRDHGHIIPIQVTTEGNLGDDLRRSLDGTHRWGGGTFTAIPFWTVGEKGKRGRGRRQCTRQFKVDAVKNEIRRQLGLKPRQRIGKHHVVQWVGISTDEATRMKPSRYKWIESQWPLIDAGMSRTDCKRWLEANGFPIPGKSACVFCPYRAPAEWAEWRANRPELFEFACKVDEALRQSKLKRPQFILDKLIPLRELPIIVDDSEPMIGECEGMCGN